MIHHEIDTCDRSFMNEARRLAASIPRRPWPNPPVGAVVVREGQVVGRGAHHGPGTPHAEAVALDEAGARARGATLYCTLEPCNHHGRMPPCAPRVIESGIARLVVAVADPNPTVAGGGADRIRGAGIQVTTGVGAEEALELIWPFVATQAFQRPFVWLKTATSLDGRFAPARRPSRSPVYLTGDAARQRVHIIRRWADVVLVGSGTAFADRPLLDTRLVTPLEACPGEDPIPAVASSRVPVDLPWAGRRHLVFSSHSADGPAIDAARAAGAVVVGCDECREGLTPASMLAGLAGVRAHTLLVEGGPRLAASFLEAGLVDRWVQYTAPRLLGSGPTWPDWDAGRAGCRLTLTRVERRGDDVEAVWDRVPFAATCARLAGRPEPAAGREGD